MSEVWNILKHMDWRVLWISLQAAFFATILSFFLGVFAAQMAMKMVGVKKSIFDGILTLPMVLPPTVTGFFLLLLFSRRRPFGIFLYEQFDVKIVQSFIGCVIAATVVSFPLMYQNVRAAFEQVDVHLIHAARTLGMPEPKIFWRVIMPSAKAGIISGTILTFARALGEYGATSMLAGNIPGKTATISQRIAMVVQDGDYKTASVWVVVILLISLSIIISTGIIGNRWKHQSVRW